MQYVKLNLPEVVTLTIEKKPICIKMPVDLKSDLDAFCKLKKLKKSDVISSLVYSFLNENMLGFYSNKVGEPLKRKFK